MNLKILNYLVPLTLAGALGSQSSASGNELQSIAWHESAPTPEPRDGFASGVIDGKFLVIGGTYWEGTKGDWRKKIFTASTHGFDPKTESWEKITDAPVPVGYAGFAQLGNRIFVLGGVQGGQVSGRIWTLEKKDAVYVWSEYGLLPQPKVFSSVVGIGNSLYVTGGASEYETTDIKGTCCTTSTVTNALWKLDVVSHQWKRLTDMPGGLRWLQQAVTDGNSIFVFGGIYQAASSDPVKSFNDVWRYEIATDHWSRVADLPPTMQLAIPVIVRGQIILIGRKKEVMAFDPKTASFSPLDPLPRVAMVNSFAWISPFIVGASGENELEGPRRRSDWTFLGRLSETAQIPSEK